jgi:hypothetical protein
MALPTTQHLGLILSGLPETLSLLVTDDTGAPVDATSLTLRIVRDHETLLVQDDFFAGYGDPPTLPTHIEKPALTTGIYRFPFGDTSFDEQNSTDLPGEYLIAWRYVGALGSTPRTVIQTAKVVSSKTMSLLPKLRLIVDKAVKVVDDNPEDPVFVGYTDEMLVQFLEGGLAWINAFQPYPMWGGLDAFPDTHWRLLLDAAVCDALTSQEIFAVDTDINYSDQGNVFVIDHQPKLAAILNATWTRLATMVPAMKRHYVRNGAVRVEGGMNWRFQTLLSAAPTGSLFRKMFVGGP